MGNVNGEKSKRGPAASLIIALLLFIFIYNGYTFLNTDGNDHPLVGSLFNMIIALSILITGLVLLIWALSVAVSV